MWHHYDIHLTARPPGFHLITDEIRSGLPHLKQVQVGICHLLLQHTSASLLLNESYDPDVRRDLASWSARQMAENEPYYVHTCEGPDDMPAHLKAAVFGVGLSIPIHRGQLCLGTWQGIWLGEHRQRAGSRHVVATIHGQMTP